MAFASSLVAGRRPNGDFGGRSYQPHSGRPSQIGTALVGPVGSDASSTIQGIGGAPILGDRPGKASNWTIDYARVVAATTELEKNEIATLYTKGRLAFVMATIPPSLYAAADSSSLNRRCAVGAGIGVDRLCRLVSYDYLTEFLEPSEANLGYDNTVIGGYIAVFTNTPRQRITHMLNMALGTPGSPHFNAQTTGLSLNTTNAGAGLVEKARKNGSVTAASFPTFAHDNGSGLTLSPYLLPSRYAKKWQDRKGLPNANSIGADRAFFESKEKDGVNELKKPEVHIHPPDASAKEQYMNPYEQARRQLEAFYYARDEGLFSERALGPWRPDGLIINKYDTSSIDDEITLALDASQNALFNVAAAGRALCTQFAVMSNPTRARMGNRLAELVHDRQRRNRLLTMPGDELYVVVIAEIVDDTTTAKVAQRLRNLRFELSTSEELGKHSTPKKSGDPESRLQATMGLKESEVIVGAWRLARVVDNSATRPAPRSGFEATRNPNSFGIDTVVDIKWKSSVDLHMKYWKDTA